MILPPFTREKLLTMGAPRSFSVERVSPTFKYAK